MQTYHCRAYARRHPAISVDELLQVLLPDPCVNLPCLDTPYSKYSNTNHAASGQDITSITEIIRQRRAQLDDVTAELASVERIMKRVLAVHQHLLDTRTQLLASIDAHRGLISCIRRLPPELLGEIFVRCLPPKPHALVEPDAGEAPLVLLAVCRRWRKVALGTPRLWCSLAVRPSRRIQQQGVFFYHHWLSRARGCPLSLAVDTRRPSRNPVWRYEATEMVQPYTCRATRLHITFDDATAPGMLLQDVPVLQHLTLEGDLSTLHGMTIVQPELRLRSLTLNTGTLNKDVLAGFNPGWTHLTQLWVTLGRAPCQTHSHATNTPIILTLLTLCPDLQDLRFSPVCLSKLDPNTSRITHTKLRTLDVDVFYGAGPLLNALTLPALQYLHIRDLDILPSVWLHRTFKAFVVRSKCPLEMLKIDGAQVAVTKAERKAYGAMIPTLRQLDVRLAVMMHA